MLIVTPSVSSERAKRYFGESLKRDDYYTRGQEVAGQWFGKGAEMLGLKGQVDQDSYFALCDNRNPANTDEQLTPRQKQNRRPMYDWTFSAPKAISVLYEYTGNEAIRDAFTQSYRETLGDAEAEMKTRVRKGGKDEDRITGNMVVAEFTHFTARPVEGRVDPHLHAHCVVFNTTFDEVENRWKASQQGDLKRDADYWEAAFHTRFARRLNELGYATVKDGSSFTLAGLPQSITEKFSMRRNQIEKEAAEKGITTAKGKHTLGARIREAKQKDVTKDVLREQWNARLSNEEREALNRVAGGSGGGGDGPISPKQAMNYALEHSFERASAVSEKRLKAEALRYAVGSVLPHDIAGIAKSEEVIAKERDGQLMTTTRKTLKAEVSMLEIASEGHGKFRPFALNPPELSGLSAEQKKAAQQILKSRDRVTGVVGKAGTGKTTMMRATINALEAEGRQKVFVFAPSSQASRGVLKDKEGFANAQTLEMLLRNEKLQKQTKGQVLWVDEAGLISSKDMGRLMELAKRNDNRVILSGDYTQHSSVEAGDAFRLMEQEAGVRLAKLTEIRRQTEPKYKKAVEAISAGGGKAAQKGFDALDRMGWVVESSGEERHGQLVSDYLRAVDEGKTALIIAPTHAEGESLTEELRGILKEQGAIGKEREFTVRRSTGWTQAQKGDARNYEPGMAVDFHEAVAGKRERLNGTRSTVGGFAKGEAVVVKGRGSDSVQVMRRDGSEAVLPLQEAECFEVSRARSIAIGRGDRIRITRNGEAAVEGQKKGTRINNGDIYTVEGFTKEGDIRLEKGKLLPKDWGHMSLGYVDTSYASQGKTVERLFVALGRASMAAANMQQWYVSLSRGKEMAKVYVEDKDEVRNAIAKGGERLSAVELTQTRIRENWRARLRKTLERNRVARFLKNRSDAMADYWRNPAPERDMGYGRG
jgi:conjugative relaxase-like TrwC/TraI family protein